jgi:hypothetical protein
MVDLSKSGIMAQLPKIVVQRLKATPQPEVHPDPDLLAAFAEKSLGDRERAPLLEHLAQCSECREIVSLAQPQFELERVAAVAAATMPAPVRPSWLRGPIFRWTALAACGAVIAVGAFTLRRQSLASKQKLAASQVAESFDAKLQAFDRQDQLAAKSEPAPPPAAQSKSKADEVSLAREPSRRTLDIPSQKGESAQSSLGLSVARKSIPAAGIAAAPSDVFAKAAKPAETTDRRKELLQAERAQVSTSMEAQPIEPAAPATASARDESRGDAKQDLDKASANELKTKKDGAPAAAPPPPQSTVAGGNLQSAQVSTGSFAGRNAVALRTLAKIVTPVWTLSSDGTQLLRSLDAGQTWQPVPVDGKIVLRAVASVGSDVWVGGSAGALYHSSNAGTDWKKVAPTVDGKILQADIVRIEFTGARHGKLTTASGEVWTTADAGQSWQRQ